MKMLLANPRGFCAGVDRAVEIVERVLDRFGAPVYVRHEVVHNRFVVDGLKQKGVVFVDELDQVPDNAIVIYSAHGVSRAVREQGGKRGLRVFDATCPLVTKVHKELVRYHHRGDEVILIGHAGHPEVDGTLGQVDAGVHLVETGDDVPALQVRDPRHLAYVTQTTLSVNDTSRVVAALRQRFPAIRSPRKDDICYATQNRQDAVRAVARRCGMMLVVGSPNSSNSNRLCEVAAAAGIPAYRIDGPEDIDRAWIQGQECIGITAGASAPEVLVQQVIDRLASWGVQGPEEVQGPQETLVFALPRELREGGH